MPLFQSSLTVVITTHPRTRRRIPRALHTYGSVYSKTPKANHLPLATVGGNLVLNQSLAILHLLSTYSKSSRALSSVPSAFILSSTYSESSSTLSLTSPYYIFFYIVSRPNAYSVLASIPQVLQLFYNTLGNPKSSILLLGRLGFNKITAS